MSDPTTAELVLRYLCDVRQVRCVHLPPLEADAEPSCAACMARRVLAGQSLTVPQEAIVRAYPRRQAQRRGEGAKPGGRDYLVVSPCGLTDNMGAD